MFRPVLLTVLLAAGVVAPSMGQPASTVAVPAAGFLNSLGANSAVSRRGERLEDTVKSVQYLGLRWIRSGYESRIPVSDLIELHRRTGVRFSYGLLSGGTDIEPLLEGARQLAEAGALLAIEGNNEPNNWGVTYQGERGGRNETWLPVATLQRDLYQAVKSDPLLKDIPVWSLTENGAQTDNVGLQFLTIPPGAGTLMRDGTRYADFANCHNYVTTILTDEGAVAMPGQLEYSITPQPPTVHDLLLQKSDGRFELIVWNERFTGGSDTVTVKFGSPSRSVTLFDPTAGVSAIRQLRDVNSVALTLSDHPAVLEIVTPKTASSPDGRANPNNAPAHE